jgi:hypothetical protein
VIAHDKGGNMKLREEVKVKWLEALRSGRYTQGTGALQRVHEDGSRSFCCLGVLCEVAIEMGVTLDVGAGVSDHPKGDVVAYDGASSYPPSKVEEFATVGGVAMEGWEVNGQSLVNMNDNSNLSFEQIASHIEAYA